MLDGFEERHEANIEMLLVSHRRSGADTILTYTGPAADTYRPEC